MFDCTLILELCSSSLKGVLDLGLDVLVGIDIDIGGKLLGTIRCSREKCA